MVLLLEKYALEQNTFCNPGTKSSWGSLKEAQEGCGDNPVCSMFYDDCGKGTDFYYCYHSAAKKKSACGSFLFDRVSKYLKLMKVHRLHTV